MKSNWQTITMLVVAAILTFIVVSSMNNYLNSKKRQELSYNEFVQMVEAGEVDSIKVGSTEITVIPKKGNTKYSQNLDYYVVRLEGDYDFVNRILDNNVVTNREKSDSSTLLLVLLNYAVPFLFLLFLMNFTMKRMGGEPLIWGAVGRDGGDYLEHFGREGIRTDGIGVFSNAYTAQCLIITDHTGAQIAAFHPGAAERTPEVRWPTDADGKEAQPAIAILSPGGRETTLFAAQACRAREIPYFFDVGQELPLFSAEELLDLAHHAVGIIYSDSEAEAFEQKTQQSDADLAESGLIVVRTLGSRGARVWLPGERHAAFVPTVPIQKVRSPVGAGDAFRGGFLYALERGFSPVEAAQWGAVAAGRKVAGAGAQDYELTPQAAQLDFDQWFGKQSRK